MKKWLILSIAVLFTLVSVLWFCLTVAGAAASLYYRHTVEDSGGIGAVSLGLAEAVVEILPFVAAAVFVNFSIADAARRAGRIAVRVRRAHLAVTVLTLFWGIPAIAVWVLLSGPGSTWADIPIVIAVGALLNALLSAAHAAFGVFAIQLLRRRFNE
jgi:hypothetical protein